MPLQHPILSLQGTFQEKIFSVATLKVDTTTPLPPPTSLISGSYPLTTDNYLSGLM